MKYGNGIISRSVCFGIFIPIFKKGKVKDYEESNVITTNGRKSR